MKLCLVSESFLPTLGGAEVAVHSLASEFAASGINTTVLTASANKMDNFDARYAIEYFPHTPRDLMKGEVFALRLLYLLSTKILGFRLPKSFRR